MQAPKDNVLALFINHCPSLPTDDKLTISLPENVKKSIDYLRIYDIIKVYDYAHTP